MADTNFSVVSGEIEIANGATTIVLGITVPSAPKTRVVSVTVAPNGNATNIARARVEVVRAAALVGGDAVVPGELDSTGPAARTTAASEVTSLTTEESVKLYDDLFDPAGGYTRGPGVSLLNQALAVRITNNHSSAVKFHTTFVFTE
jgi:hypothetical protein